MKDKYELDLITAALLQTCIDKHVAYQHHRQSRQGDARSLFTTCGVPQVAQFDVVALAQYRHTGQVSSPHCLKQSL